MMLISFLLLYIESIHKALIEDNVVLILNSTVFKKDIAMYQAFYGEVQATQKKFLLQVVKQAITIVYPHDSRNPMHELVVASEQYETSESAVESVVVEDWSALKHKKPAAKALKQLVIQNEIFAAELNDLGKRKRPSFTTVEIASSKASLSKITDKIASLPAIKNTRANPRAAKVKNQILAKAVAVPVYAKKIVAPPKSKKEANNKKDSMY